MSVLLAYFIMSELEPTNSGSPPAMPWPATACVVPVWNAVFNTSAQPYVCQSPLSILYFIIGYTLNVPYYHNTWLYGSLTADHLLAAALLEVDSATSVDMTYNGIGVISGFALKGVAPFCIHPQTFVPHHV
jgi:hypothetical protein